MTAKWYLLRDRTEGGAGETGPPTFVEKIIVIMVVFN